MNLADAEVWRCRRCILCKVVKCILTSYATTIDMYLGDSEGPTSGTYSLDCPASPVYSKRHAATGTSRAPGGEIWRRASSGPAKTAVPCFSKIGCGRSTSNRTRGVNRHGAGPRIQLLLDPGPRLRQEGSEASKPSAGLSGVVRCRSIQWIPILRVQTARSAGRDPRAARDVRLGVNGLPNDCPR